MHSKNILYILYEKHTILVQEAVENYDIKVKPSAKFRNSYLLTIPIFDSTDIIFEVIRPLGLFV